LRYRKRPFLWLWPRAKAESTKFMRCLEPAMSFCVMGVLSAIFGGVGKDEYGEAVGAL
jgi:branched-subunit amino acid transport protein AzlD